jgi:hypothetical protein
VFMHYSRILSGPMYASSTAVASMEVLKFVTCVTVVSFQSGIGGAYRSLRDEVIAQPGEILKMAVPSLLYTVQNNLLYYALSHLDAATFQVGIYIYTYIGIIPTHPAPLTHPPTLLTLPTTYHSPTPTPTPTHTHTHTPTHTYITLLSIYDIQVVYQVKILTTAVEY